MGEEIQGYHGDWISQASKSFPALSVSVSVVLSFETFTLPWSPGLGYAFRGQMDDIGWEEESTEAEKLLEPF